MVAEARAALILVVEEIHETREGIQRLLKADGYSVAVSKDESGAVESMLQTRPDLMLVSLAGASGEVLVTARRIREQAAVEEMPMVFWVEDIDEGEELEIGKNVYLTRPDNFNQLRGLLARVLDREIMGVHIANEFAAD